MENLQKMLASIDVQKYVDMTVSGVLSYLPSLIGALLTLWIGFKIVKAIIKAIDKALSKAKLDDALKKFIESIVSVILKVLVLLAAAGMIGIQTTSFIAILGAAGLAVGMALSGTLQNFAGGVMILLFKPFKVGDFIEVAGYAGVVKEINIFNTVLLTGDKKTIIIPNSDISGKSLVNYSTEPKRRIDLEVGISYDDDIDLAKATLKEIAMNDEAVLKDEDITIGVSSLGDNAVIIVFRVFVNASDYWPTYFRLNETIKKTFDKKGLNFPYPQRDVHLYNMDK